MSESIAKLGKAIWSVELVARGIFTFVPSVPDQETMDKILLKLEMMVNQIGAIEVDGTVIHIRAHFDGETIKYKTNE